MINFIFLSLFPQYFHNYFQTSIAKIALGKKLINYRVYNLRDFANKGQTDDYIYGGGTGMLLKIDCLVRALANIQEVYSHSYLILLSPQGKIFTQKDVPRLTKKTKNIVFICGHYEGFDERILYYVDEQISIGDFITSGGELPSLLITDALIRSISGVIKETSYLKDSFTQSANLDFASYTRPEIFDGFAVPKVLLTGNHRKIEEWRNKNSWEKTEKKDVNYINKNKTTLPNPNQWRLSVIKK